MYLCLESLYIFPVFHQPWSLFSFSHVSLRYMRSSSLVGYHCPLMCAACDIELSILTGASLFVLAAPIGSTASVQDIDRRNCRILGCLRFVIPNVGPFTRQTP